MIKFFNFVESFVRFSTVYQENLVVGIKKIFVKLRKEQQTLSDPLLFYYGFPTEIVV